MDKKEKIFIVSVTLVILVAVFIMFLVSNSQKLPPEVLIENEEHKVVTAVMGGYRWKVFGRETIADSLDITSLEYTSNNTIVSKSNAVLTFKTTEKFTVSELKYIENESKEETTVTPRVIDTDNYFTINTPKEGNYLCYFKLEFYGKGTAEYAVKVVVTDENIYDVNQIISFKNTDISDIENVKKLISSLPYEEKLNRIAINTVDEPKSITIQYDDDNITKDNLSNNAIALFALIPELDAISYRVSLNREEVYFTRQEINNMLSRNVLDYASDKELWKKEIIYKEPVSKYSSNISLYSGIIQTSLSKLLGKEIGSYIAIDVGTIESSGDLSLNEFERETLLDEISSQYLAVITISGDTGAKNGTVVKIDKNKNSDENNIILDVIMKDSKNTERKYSYKVIKDEKSVQLEEYVEENLEAQSGEKE